MRFWQGALRFLLCASAAIPIEAASSWGFGDATVSVQTKGAGVGAGLKENLIDNKPLSKPVPLGTADTLKIELVTQQGRTPKRPHQAFLLLKDPETGLDTSYPFSVRDNGKSRVELTQKDLPIQFTISPKTVDASFVIASFGSSLPYYGPAFTLSIERNPNEPRPAPVEAPRYGKLPEVHHIFKPSAQSPPFIVTLVFLALVVLLPTWALVGVWTYLGANTKHFSAALKSAPAAHGVFLASLVSLEGIFFLYYTYLNLFQMLPAALAVGTVAFISGSRALSEVQGRRLAGLR